MKYFKRYKDELRVYEVSKEEARRTLEGYWNPESLKDIFDNNKCFQLFTPYSIVWTQDDMGLVPIAGFYGVVGE